MPEATETTKGTFKVPATTRQRIAVSDTHCKREVALPKEALGVKSAFTNPAPKTDTPNAPLVGTCLGCTEDTSGPL